MIARYDADSSHAYIGDSAGQITIMTVTADTAHKVDTMKKHSSRNYFELFLIIVKGGATKTDCFWELITSRHLMAERCIICQKFPNFV